jgi:hypothetical protein
LCIIVIIADGTNVSRQDDLDNVRRFARKYYLNGLDTRILPDDLYGLDILVRPCMHIVSNSGPSLTPSTHKIKSSSHGALDHLYQATPLLIGSHSSECLPPILDLPRDRLRETVSPGPRSRNIRRLCRASISIHIYFCFPISSLRKHTTPPTLRSSHQRAPHPLPLALHSPNDQARHILPIAVPGSPGAAQFPCSTFRF